MIRDRRRDRSETDRLLALRRNDETGHKRLESSKMRSPICAKASAILPAWRKSIAAIRVLASSSASRAVDRARKRGRVSSKSPLLTSPGQIQTSVDTGKCWLWSRGCGRTTINGMKAISQMSVLAWALASLLASGTEALAGSSTLRSLSPKALECRLAGINYPDGAQASVPGNCGLSAVVWCPPVRQTCRMGVWSRRQFLDPSGRPLEAFPKLPRQ